MYLQHRAQPYVDGGANTRAESSTVVGLTKILRCSAPSLFFLCSPLPHATGINYRMGQSQMSLIGLTFFVFITSPLYLIDSIYVQRNYTLRCYYCKLPQLDNRLQPYLATIPPLPSCPWYSWFQFL